MADVPMTAATHLAAIVPEIWSRRYYDSLLEGLAFRALLGTDYEGEIRDLGDTVNISQFPQFTDGNDVAESADNDAEAVTVTGQQLVINHRIAKDFILTRLSMAQSLPAMDQLSNLAIFSIMKKIEKLIIAAIVPNAAAPDHSIAYTTGTTLALVDILNAKELLDAANVAQENRHMVLGSAQMNDVFNIAGFTSSDFLLAGAPLQTGQLPAALLGFAPHLTTLVGNVSYFFHPSFMTFAAQEGMAVNQYDLGGLNGKRQLRVNVDTLVGFKQLDGKRVVSIS